MVERPTQATKSVDVYCTNHVLNKVQVINDVVKIKEQPIYQEKIVEIE